MLRCAFQPLQKVMRAGIKANGGGEKNSFLPVPEMFLKNVNLMMAGLLLSWVVRTLTLSHTTNRRLFQPKRVCRRQFQI